MKPLSQIAANVVFETFELIENFWRYITRKPEPKPSLLALNLNWFTNCNWLEQLIAFKQIDSYYSNKH